MRYTFILFGALFGFLLSRAGATTYDFYANLFLFKDLQLMGVMATAAAVGFVGITLMKRLRVRAVATKEPIAFKGKPMKKGLIAGSLLFGAGWGLAGACPGTALAMLGEGKLMAGFSIIGIVLGTYAYGLWQSASESIRTAPPRTESSKAPSH